MYAGSDALGIKPLFVKQLPYPALRDERILDTQVHCRGMQAHAGHLAKHAFTDAACDNALLHRDDQLR